MVIVLWTAVGGSISSAAELGSVGAAQIRRPTNVIEGIKTKYCPTKLLKAHEGRRPDQPGCDQGPHVKLARAGYDQMGLGVAADLII